MAKLYEIKKQAEFLRDFGMDTETGEIIGNEEDVKVMLDVLELDMTEKLEACGIVVKEMLSDVEAYDAEIAKLQARKKARKNRAESLKAYIAANLTEDGEIETARIKMKWRNNAESVFIDDLSLIPSSFYKVVEPEADKTRIKEALKAGTPIPGAHLERTRSVMIK